MAACEQIELRGALLRSGLLWDAASAQLAQEQGEHAGRSFARMGVNLEKIGQLQN